MNPTPVTTPPMAWGAGPTVTAEMAAAAVPTSE